MLVKVELDEKAKDDLSPVTKQNGTLAKYTNDAGDLKLFKSSDGTRTYLRVWETQPVPEGKSGAAKYVKHFYEIVAPAATAATPAADIK